MGSRQTRPALLGARVIALGLRLWQIDRQLPLDDECHAIAMLATADH